MQLKNFLNILNAPMTNVRHLIFAPMICGVTIFLALTIFKNCRAALWPSLVIFASSAVLCAGYRYIKISDFKKGQNRLAWFMYWFLVAIPSLTAGYLAFTFLGWEFAFGVLGGSVVAHIITLDEILLKEREQKDA